MYHLLMLWWLQSLLQILMTRYVKVNHVVYNVKDHSLVNRLNCLIQLNIKQEIDRSIYNYSIDRHLNRVLWFVIFFSHLFFFPICWIFIKLNPICLHFIIAITWYVSRWIIVDLNKGMILDLGHSVMKSLISGIDVPTLEDTNMFLMCQVKLTSGIYCPAIRKSLHGINEQKYITEIYFPFFNLQKQNKTNYKQTSKQNKIYIHKNPGGP